LRGLLKAHYPKLSSQAFDESPETSSPAAMVASILSIQSHVVYGHVGNSATVFPLQRLSCEVWPIHTVQFSNHTGYPDWRGAVFDAALIDDCMAGLSARGALARCDGVLSGYLGSPEIGAALLRAVSAVRAANSGAAWCCDPVLGDTGRGLYVRPGVAEFMRDALPAATILTPNHFELDLLTGTPSRSLQEARAAINLLLARGPRVVVATSIDLDSTPADCIDMLVGDSDDCWRLRTPKAPIAVNGAGDLLAALFLAHWLESHSAPGALGKAASSVYGVIAATLAAGSRELLLVAAQDEFVRPTRSFVAQKIEGHS
jgi:pyridoxine kinase